MYMNQDSPFEKWRLENMRQVAVSPEILELVARAFENGFIDGMQQQMKSSVDKAVNAMHRKWVGLTDVERSQLVTLHHGWNEYGKAIEAKLKEKNT